MEHRIEDFTQKKVIGKRITMSLADNKTGELWRDFMTNRRLIHNQLGADLYSIQVYSPSHFDEYNSARQFEKWAAAEVADFNAIPAGMAALTIESGLYAVFLHKGAASTGPKSFNYIFTEWLPDSRFVVDNRPHFEVLGAAYKNEDPGSEEEIWIPIKRKK